MKPIFQNELRSSRVGMKELSRTVSLWLTVKSVFIVNRCNHIYELYQLKISHRKYISQKDIYIFFLYIWHIIEQLTPGQLTNVLGKYTYVKVFNENREP